MISTRVTVEGLRRAREILLRLPDLGDEAMEQIATSIRSLVRGRTPVGIVDDEDHTPGTMKGSWTIVSHTATGFTFGSGVPYARVLEEGGYKGVGPRTVAFAGGGGASAGIYSRQAPGGMITPIVDDENYITKVTELVIREMVRGMDSVS